MPPDRDDASERREMVRHEPVQHDMVVQWARGAGLSHRQARKMRRLLRRTGSRAGKGLSLAAGGLAIAAVATTHWWLLAPAVIVGLFAVAFGAGAVALQVGEAGGWRTDVGGASLGMGSHVEDGAQIEPGASVEMGATVRSGAIVRSGAVVGMGSTVDRNAVIEANATVGWGATIHEGATVGHDAIVGAGATVKAGAVVEAGTRVGAGSTVSTGRGRAPALPRPQEAPRPAPATTDADARETRMDELCDRLDGEIAKLSPRLDEILSKPQETVTTLRRTAHDLLRRDRLLRSEANPAEKERLEREAATLRDRVAAESDPITKQRLQGAVSAIEEQQRQRELLLRDANRLDAEHTRLVWTAEGLLAHVIRLRTTEALTQGATAELDAGLTRLREEVSAVAGAIEHVQQVDVSGFVPPETTATEPSFAGQHNPVSDR